ncbi:MAG: hypothetical protein A2741_00830 [Candidatus Zambryskibacteria bacterium RIFCSPHIGHO2_01_FULL_43_27]|uniref:DUF5652 domain-containing protein n=1 Tax=Candidatus Zambryskibacteria bacterium RIFCSPLOWO2_01_FULL_43_17 TaxID=1802760 RepID=A0A1G2U6K5_9BACT|nr:MAG: hypothetical protein A2741_00830 [Candidatus Zambryskibacteria bacterium RIFCSPHIGHO2_01_FULL_43_27]OHB00468.1 MAG: hypothetical protein A3E93_01550 [Candidatus Zambryskibacteria bacterium RIFCSPHIGHO2_12_FULL_43_12b]OHB04582.1 MAG: hypothetical protein A2920_01410 [Candidatus Zambryskibacteria bacterium RIFCSPLOWO2_01_FULL_43_17]
MTNITIQTQAFAEYLSSHLWLLALIIIWSVIWKGLALWRSARLSQKGWFLVVLLVNTVGILEIIYLFFISRKQAESEITQ